MCLSLRNYEKTLPIVMRRYAIGRVLLWVNRTWNLKGNDVEVWEIIIESISASVNYSRVNLGHQYAK